MKKNIRFTLGIETSCDETAAAVYDAQHGIVSNVLYSQIALHKEYGGVVPEIASRAHLEKIDTIVAQALEKAQLTLNDIDVVAVTHKPGLPGSLLIGVCFAKAIAWSAQKQLIGVNHLEGHAFSAFLEHTIPFPHLCLTASGGHTSLYIVEDFGAYTVIGQTVDDAAGEAFDKVAKILGLGYPGGPIIEQRAALAHFKDYFSYPRSTSSTLDFSFSGLKTAVLYDLVKQQAYDMATKTFLKAGDDEFINKVCSSLLVAIKDIFIQKIARARQQYPAVKAVTFVGGVACNKYIKTELQQWCNNHGISLYWPSAQYCTDNAAMIAYVGNYKAQQGHFSDLTLDILK